MGWGPPPQPVSERVCRLLSSASSPHWGRCLQDSAMGLRPRQTAREKVAQLVLHTGPRRLLCTRLSGTTAGGPEGVWLSLSQPEGGWADLQPVDPRCPTPGPPRWPPHTAHRLGTPICGSADSLRLPCPGSDPYRPLAVCSLNRPCSVPRAGRGVREASWRPGESHRAPARDRESTEKTCIVIQGPLSACQPERPFKQR